ncbi:fibronectin type III domain-containing protein [Limisalsivibrio acetivorans]|uniref:fibronectin type III domain-containing protein n=1 Tax=Limisalsivibrio acetivorans TaxID=1304888 RepID=UPI0003B35B62|nr:fibronectin type III domain-containing protein [Limisalsivibrio acetivorans]
MFIRTSKLLILAVLLAVFLAGGAFATELNLPTSIAVLPVQGDGNHEDLEELRITFFNHIGSKNYVDVEINDVNNRIFLLEKKTGKKWTEFSHRELSDTLGVGGLLYVNVIGIDKIYAGVYGSLTVRMRVKLVDAETGNILWEKEDKVVKQSGGVPLSPWSAISTAVTSALVLRDSVKIQLFDKLCRAIAKEMPEPQSLAKEKPPAVFSVVTNSLDSPFKSEDEVLVSLKGEEGLSAYFNIGDEQKGISMSEMEPGHYLGKYVVASGNNWNDQQIVVYLNDPDKRMETRYIVPRTITVDTVPPGAPLSLSSSSTEEGVRLFWEKPEDEDIQDYIIEKADLSDTTFKEIGTTSIPEFVDGSVEYGNRYYYRVRARDQAENIGRYIEQAKMVVRPGPTDVSPDIIEDTTFYAYGSPYIINGSATVSKGVTLTIEKGTAVRFGEGSSLNIMGTLKAEGSGDENITFRGENYTVSFIDAGINAGSADYITMRGGHSFRIINSTITLKGFKMENFTEGLKALNDSEVNIDSGRFLYCGTAVNASGSSVHLDNTTLGQSTLALSADGEASLSAGRITLEGNGMDIETASPFHAKVIDIGERESFDLLERVSGDVTAEMIVPFGRTFAELKQESKNELLLKISLALEDQDIVEAGRYADILKSLFPDEYRSSAPVIAFIRHSAGNTEEARSLLEGDRSSAGITLSSLFGYNESKASEGLVVRVANVKLPIVRSGEGLDNIAADRALKRAVKDHLSRVMSRLDRDKLFALNSKILSRADEYASMGMPVYTNFGKNRFDGSYMVFINDKKLQEDLKGLNLAGDAKRGISAAVAYTGATSHSLRYVRGSLKDMGFKAYEIPSAGRSVSAYETAVAGKGAQLLLLVSEDFSTSDSRVSNNLRMISANLEIRGIRMPEGRQLFNITKGVVTYHMNDEIGKRDSMKTAFAQVDDFFESRMIEAEKAIVKGENPPQSTEKAVVVPYESNKPAPKPAQQKSEPVSNKPAPEMQDKKTEAKGDPVMEKAAERAGKTVANGAAAAEAASKGVAAAGTAVVTEAVKAGAKGVENKAEAKPEKVPEKKPVPPLKLAVSGIRTVFAAEAADYQNKPLMRVEVINPGEKAVSGVAVNLRVEGLLPERRVHEFNIVPVKDKATAEINLDFGSALCCLKGNKRFKLDLSAVYELDGDEKKITSEGFMQVYGIDRIVWDNGYKIGMLINSEEPVIARYAEQIRNTVSSVESGNLSPKAVQTLAILEAMGREGIKLKERPSSFVKNYGRGGDAAQVKFPVETIHEKSGDYDSLFILFATLADAMGIDTAFAVSNVRLIALADTGMSPASIPDADKYFAEIEGTLWMPVDLSVVRNGSAEAWKAGADGGTRVGKGSAVFVGGAKDLFDPVKLPDQRDIPAPPADLSDEVKTAIEGVIIE